MTIVVVDDDPDDRFMIRRALESCMRNPVQVLNDGEELIAFLLDRVRSNSGLSGRHVVILLDLNMPRKSGHEALLEIRRHPDLRAIPVIVMTTSDAEAEVLRSYELGANAHITKPSSFGGFVQAMRGLGAFWLDTVSLPCA